MILLSSLLLGLALEAEHQRDVGAGDVRVEQADRRPVARQRDGEVDRDRALADAALARGDRDHVLDAREQLLRRPRRGAADRRAPGQLDRLDADRVERRVDARLDLVLERAGRRRQLDLERDLGAVDDEVLDHVPGDEVAAELRLLDVPQRLHDGGFGDLQHAVGGLWCVQRVRRPVRSVSDGPCVDIVAAVARGAADEAPPAPRKRSASSAISPRTREPPIRFLAGATPSVAIEHQLEWGWRWSGRWPEVDLADAKRREGRCEPLD